MLNDVDNYQQLRVAERCSILLYCILQAHNFWHCELVKTGLVPEVPNILLANKMTCMQDVLYCNRHLLIK